MLDHPTLTVPGKRITYYHSRAIARMKSTPRGKAKYELKGRRLLWYIPSIPKLDLVSTSGGSPLVRF